VQIGIVCLHTNHSYLDAYVSSCERIVRIVSLLGKNWRAACPRRHRVVRVPSVNQRHQQRKLPAVVIESGGIAVARVVSERCEHPSRPPLLFVQSPTMPAPGRERASALNGVVIVVKLLPSRRWMSTAATGSCHEADSGSETFTVFAFVVCRRPEEKTVHVKVCTTKLRGSAGVRRRIGGYKKDLEGREVRVGVA